MQTTTISEDSTKKPQDMPTVIRGIAKVAKGYRPMPTEENQDYLEDFR